MSAKTVYIVHGYMASPTDHWFEWLKAKVEGEGGTTRIVPMPDSMAPDAQAWLETLEREATTLDANTFFVAHSLGCIATLRFLSRHRDARIGGLIAISGFEQKLPNIPELDAFMAERDYDPATVREVAPQRTVIAAQNDEIVSADLSRDLAASLDAECIVLADGGHFLGSDGFDSFPLVWEELGRQAAAGAQTPR